MGYYKVEGRWENTRESITASCYHAIEEVGGSLNDAKRTAQEYLYARVSRASPRLQWTEGTNGTRPAYYASNPAITFRITS